MGLFNTVQFMENLPLNFENDGYELTPEMEAKYAASEVGIVNGQMRSRNAYFCKNASVFDLAGRKIAWGDIAPKDLEGMLGVYYILSEHKSFWEVDKKAVKKTKFREKDPQSQSPLPHLLIRYEAAELEPAYVKQNAIARIVDGEIQTSRELIRDNY